MVTVALKRSKAADTQADDEKVRQQIEDAERKGEMLDAARSEYLGLLPKLQKGLAKWQTERFAWEEPDWDADPETWPVAARVLYRFAQLHHLENDIGWLSTVGMPKRCPLCEPAEDGAYFAFYCPEHQRGFAVGLVKHKARELFNSPRAAADAHQAKVAEGSEEVAA